MKESHELFKANLQQQHEQLKQLFSRLIGRIGTLRETNSTTMEKDISNIVTAMSSCCNFLQKNIVQTERPRWLNELRSSCDEYLTKNFDSTSFSRIFAQHQNTIMHQWNFGAINGGVNFDSIYQEYKRNSELPKLLDELISLIEKLINECGDEIQTKTLNDLNQLLSTVKLNKKGSFGAIQSSLFLVWDFFKTSFFILYPQLKIANEAIQTVLKIEKLLKSAHKENEKIGEQVVKQSTSTFKSSFTYSQTGLLEDNSMIPEDVSINIKG